ncbi:MAG: MFS transporter [Anaerolineales bacterium]
MVLNLYLLRLGYGPEFIGLFNGMSSLGFALSCLPAGALGARLGSRRAMSTGLILTMLGFFLLPVGELLPLFQGGWLVATRLLVGFGESLFFVNARPFVMALAHPRMRGHVFSMRSAVQPLGGFVGSLLGGFLPGFFARLYHIPLDHPLPYRLPLLLAPILLLPALLAIRCTKDASPRQSQGPERSNVNRGKLPLVTIALVAFFSLFRGVGRGSTSAFFNVYLDTTLDVPTATIGTINAAGQIVSIILALFTPLFIAHLGNAQSYLLGSLATALSLLLIALAPHWAVAGLGGVGVNAIAGITIPTFSVYQMEAVGIPWRSIMSGSTSMAIGVSRSLIALGGGFIVAAMGYRSLFSMGASLMLAGVLLFWIFGMRLSGDPMEE